MMAILAISEQHIKLLEKSSVFFLLVGQSSHSLHVHVHTHTSQTHNYIRTSVCSSFSQEGRICCQHTILLPVLSSPAYLCGMLLKMINCYFLICPLQDFFCLTAFNGPTRPEITNTHMQGCTRYQAKAIASGAVVGSPASDQAVRLDLARTPVPLSSTITSQEKKKAKDGVQGKIQSQWRKFSQIFGCTISLCFFLLELDSSLSVFPPNASLAMLPQNQIQTWKKSALSHSAET